MSDERAVRAVAGWSLSSIVPGDDPAATALLRGGAVLMGGCASVHATSAGLDAVIDVTADGAGRLVAVAVHVSRTDGGPVDSRAIRRVPVGMLVRSVVADDPALTAGQRRMDGEARMAAVVETWRRFRVDPTNAHRATAATAHELHVSRGYVSRLLSQARREGHIPA